MGAPPSLLNGELDTKWLLRTWLYELLCRRASPFCFLLGGGCWPGDGDGDSRLAMRSGLQPVPDALKIASLMGSGDDALAPAAVGVGERRGRWCGDAIGYCTGVDKKEQRFNQTGRKELRKYRVPINHVTTLIQSGTTTMRLSSIFHV